MKIVPSEKKQLQLKSWLARILPYTFLYHDKECKSKMKYVPFYIESLINTYKYQSVHIIRKINDDPFAYCLQIDDTTFVFFIMTTSFHLNYDKEIISKRLKEQISIHAPKQKCTVKAYFITSFDKKDKKILYKEFSL